MEAVVTFLLGGSDTMSSKLIKSRTHQPGFVPETTKFRLTERLDKDSLSLGQYRLPRGGGEITQQGFVRNKVFLSAN